MSSEPIPLPDDTAPVHMASPGCRRLMSSGAVRVRGGSLHAWVAKKGHINDGGIFFPDRAYDSPKFATGAQVLVGDEPIGRVYGLAMSSDEYLVAMCSIEGAPDWMLGETTAYAVAEYSAEHIRCPICKSIIKRSLSACECIWHAPTWVFSNICLESVRILPFRRDDYIEEYRRRALSKFLADVTPSVAPGFLHNGQEPALPKDRPSAELPEPPGYGGAL